MNSVEVIIGSLGNAGSQRLLSYYVERWYSTPLLSRKIIETIESIIHGTAKERSKIIIKVAFTKVSDNVYDLHITKLEEALLSIFEDLIKSSLKVLLKDRVPIPESIIPPFFK